MVGPRTALAGVALVLVAAVPPVFLAFSASQTLTPSAKICGLLPIADLESLYGAKAGTPQNAIAAEKTAPLTVTLKDGKFAIER